MRARFHDEGAWPRPGRRIASEGMPDDIAPAAMTRTIRPAVRARTRERILAAAADILVETGLRQATMDGIARRLKTSKVALYRYFETKDALIAGVLERIADRMLAQEHEPWPGMEAALARTLALARAERSAFLLLFRVAAHDPELSRHGDRVRRTMTEATRRRMALVGHPLKDDPLLLDALADGLVAFLIETTAFWVESGDPARDPAWIAWAGAAGRRLLGIEPTGRRLPLPPVLDQPASD